ncbi:YncE family protein [Flammeovirga aprica]|uniref:YncE family protein n=1 Tax=Flammeovirga aprica JL-4 TaxID=694437 RepID=A0A7X9RUS0_9BACT|nr:hypothetical protein [Flammeovirga aprica]NME69079.1 hypothetical protein [Flammeovirga aprica JL-4]
MKNNYKFQLIFAFIAILFTSCIEDKETTPYVPGSEGVHVGNNGSLNKPEDSSITAYTISGNDTTESQLAYQSINGEHYNGAMEGFNSNGQVTVITTANKNQVIACDTKTLQRKFVVTDSVENPRYTAFDGNLAYVTVWGEIQPDYSYIRSKVLVINLTTGELENWFSVGNKPEGIVVKNGKIYVAASNTTNVEVYNASDLTAAPELINIDAAPQHFALDKDNNLWVSATGSYSFNVEDKNKGIVKLNTSNNTTSDFINYTGMGMEGHINASADGAKVYAIGGEAWQDTSEAVEINLSSKNIEVIAQEKGFKAAAQNPSTKDIFVSVTPSYTEPGYVNVYSETGEFKSKLEAGVNPTHFIFY